MAVQVSVIHTMKCLLAIFQNYSLSLMCDGSIVVILIILLAI